VDDVIRQSPAVAAFLNNPTINKKKKAPVIEQAFGSNCSTTLKNFLGVLNANGRLNMVSSVRQAVRNITDARNNRLRVTVTSAVPLGDEQQEKIKKTLKAALSMEPVLTVKENPDLLGGLVVQFGDKVVDSSVRSRLESLRTALMTQGTSYVLQN
jgi:F-type H+-transporting ATPase subunit delta